MKYLPVGPHGAVLMQPPCIRDWFAAPYLSDSVFIITLLGGGVVLIIYGLRRRGAAKVSMISLIPSIKDNEDACLQALKSKLRRHNKMIKEYVVLDPRYQTRLDVYGIKR